MIKEDIIFKKIEYLVRDYMIQRTGGVENANGELVDAVFTTSEETDVRELIHDGYSVDEICLIIRHW